MNMNPTQNNKDRIASDFAATMSGKMDQAALDAAVAALKASDSTASYPCGASFGSFVFYIRIHVTVSVSGGKEFVGNAGGLAGPGGGGAIGTLYTPDLNALYENTHSFEFNNVTIGVGYFSVLFFDKHHKLLGHAETAALSTLLAGIGGGTGKWK